VVAAVRLGLSLLSYRVLKRWLKDRQPSRQLDPEEQRRIAWAVRNAARLVPRASCLTQAIATQYLFARSGQRSQIRIGVARDPEGRLLAHAWLVSDGRVVIGGSARDLRRYRSLTDLDVGSP
jgi:hypothetical protein